MTKKFPNVVIIVMDTASAKHMSLYGYQRSTTPQLERLADRSQVYTRCFAPSSWTLPSHASMFTGLYPSEHGVDGFNPDNLILSSNYQQLDHILKLAGYRTYAVSDNPLISPLYGLCGAIDSYHGLNYTHWDQIKMKIGDDAASREAMEKIAGIPNKWKRLGSFLSYCLRHRKMDVFRMFLKTRLDQALHKGIVYQSAPFTRRAFKTAQEQVARHRRSHSEEPFFLFINVVEPHHFYNPPPASRYFSRPRDRQELDPFLLFLEDYADSRARLLPVWQNLYDDEIRFLDGLVGQFRDHLAADGTLDNTVFIVTSDHGEHFGEKGFYAHYHSLLNELIFVPLMVSYPAGMKSPGSDDRLVGLTDFFATILDIIESPFPHPRNSYSLLSAERRRSVSSMNIKAIENKMYLAEKLKAAPPWAENLVTHTYAMILENNLKILAKDDGSTAIYHLGRDPHEEHDLAPSLDPQILEDLLLLLAQDQSQTGFTPYSPVTGADIRLAQAG